MDRFVEILGRFLLGGYFIYGGINHVIHVRQMASYAQSKSVPLPSAAVILTGILLLFGGVTVVLQIWVNAGLIALIIFLVPVTLTMHAFWKVQDPASKMGEMINFWKNIALLGAVLMLLGR